MLELRAVRHVAGGVEILHETTHRFTDGAFNVVLGPNGAGKSTMLRIAAGLLRPTGGSVALDGEDLGALPAESLARRRAVLTQHVELAFPLPVRDVVLMGRYPYYGSVPTPRDLEIVDAALALVEMQDRALQPYPTLSGGEQQKVQLARVLAQIWRDDTVDGAHRYLFLDEPTSSLDVHYQLHLLGVAKSLVSEQCTVIAVLHDLNTAFEYADRIVLMDRGSIVFEGSRGEELPGELLERVFRIQARRIVDEGRGYWRFSL